MPVGIPSCCLYCVSSTLNRIMAQLVQGIYPIGSARRFYEFSTVTVNYQLCLCFNIHFIIHNDCWTVRTIGLFVIMAYLITDIANIQEVSPYDDSPIYDFIRRTLSFYVKSIHNIYHIV